MKRQGLMGKYVLTNIFLSFSLAGLFNNFLLTSLTVLSLGRVSYKGS